MIQLEQHNDDDDPCMLFIYSVLSESFCVNVARSRNF